jgi:predicted DNA-binding ribbon-helix-helix protein
MTDSLEAEEGGGMSRGRSSTLVNRNVTIRGRRTSLRLEPAMWDALHEVAQREGASVHEICSRVEFNRQESTLTAAIRVFILAYFREAATEQGHSLAGHGRRRGVIGGVAEHAGAGAADDSRREADPLDGDQAADGTSTRRPRSR